MKVISGKSIEVIALCVQPSNEPLIILNSQILGVNFLETCKCLSK